MTPKQVAINLIEYYVLRGDSYQSLKSGQQGTWCSDYHCGIYKDKIVVSEIKGVECNYVFSLRKIYDEIKAGQQYLF